MPVAQACGVTGVWAEYGTYVSGEYRERLAIISAKSVTRRHVADETAVRWPLTVSSFHQVLEVVDGTGPRRRPARPAPRRARRPARR
jgi:phosphoglycolate phosphatase